MERENLRGFKLKCDMCGSLLESIPYLPSKRNMQFLRLYCDICGKKINRAIIVKENKP